MSEQEDLKSKTRDLFIRFLDSYSKIRDGEDDVLLMVMSELTHNNCAKDIANTVKLKSIITPLLKQANAHVEANPDIKFTFTEHPHPLGPGWLKYLNDVMNMNDGIPFALKNVLVQEKSDLDSDKVDREYFAPSLKLLSDYPKYDDIINCDLTETYTGGCPSFNPVGLTDVNKVIKPVSVYITLFQGTVDVIATDSKTLIEVTILDDNTEDPNTKLYGISYKATCYLPSDSDGICEDLSSSLYNLVDDNIKEGD